MRFDDRVAIVTGAGRGMGAAHAREFAARGASVVVNDPGTARDGLGTDPTVAQEVVNSILTEGGRAVANTDSVVTPNGAEAIVETALEEFGRVDIVVNNAGILKIQPFVDETPEDFMRQISVHLAGSFNVTHAAWPHMLENRFARVVMITSSAFFGIANHIGYASAKAGMIGLVKSLALIEEPGIDIRVNAIAPEAATRMHTTTDDETPPVDSVLKPELVSAGVMYLSHESCQITGEILGVGGGSVDRIFVGATKGYYSEEITPEGIQDNLASIMDEAGYAVPRDWTGHADLLRPPSR